MWGIALDFLEKRWKLGGLVIFAFGLLWIGWNGRDITITQLDRFFFTDAQAQVLEGKFESRIKGVEDKVDALGAKVDLGRIASIEGAIFNLRVEACMHPAGALRVQYEEQISKLIVEWRILSKTTTGLPAIPSCRDLGQE